MNRQVAGKWSYRGLGWVRNIKKIYVEKCNGPHFIGDIQLMRPNESIIRCSVFGNPSFQMDLWHLFYQVSPNPPISNIIAEPARGLQGKLTVGPCWAHVALSLVPTTALQHWKNTLSEVSCFFVKYFINFWRDFFKIPHQYSCFSGWTSPVSGCNAGS